MEFARTFTLQPEGSFKGPRDAPRVPRGGGGRPSRLPTVHPHAPAEGRAKLQSGELRGRGGGWPLSPRGIWHVPHPRGNAARLPEAPMVLSCLPAPQITSPADTQGRAQPARGGLTAPLPRGGRGALAPGGAQG